jgi:hypothetical protein
VRDEEEPADLASTLGEGEAWAKRRWLRDLAGASSSSPVLRENLIPGMAAYDSVDG